MFVRKGNRVKFLDFKGTDIIENCTEYEGIVITKNKLNKWYWWIKDTKGITHQVEKWQIIRKIKVISPISVGGICISPIYPAPDAPRPPKRGSSVQKDNSFFTEKCRECLFFRVGGGRIYDNNKNK